MNYTLDETLGMVQYYLEINDRYKVLDEMPIDNATELVNEANKRGKLFLTNDNEYQIGVKGDVSNQIFYFKGQLEAPKKKGQ